MKSTLKKLPLILAFAVAILASGCVEETTIEPTRTEEDKNPPPPPPPTGYNAVFSDITAVPAA